MKIKLLVAAAATVVASTAMAQSAFEGFYGQAGVGYENNTVSSRSITVTAPAGSTGGGSASAPSSSGGGFSGVLGLGYNFSVAPQWIVGLGADYAPTSVTTSTQALCNGCDSTNNYKIKNRYNIFITPGYEIDKDKLVYAKGGFSSQSMVWQGQAGFAGYTNSMNVNGFVAGLGYKQLVDKNIYVFGEGNYYSYSSKTLTATTSTGYVLSQPQTPSAYQFLVGVGYKF
jgi:outer membrane immunogenic protein